MGDITIGNITCTLYQIGEPEKKDGQDETYDHNQVGNGDAYAPYTVTRCALRYENQSDLNYSSILALINHRDYNFIFSEDSEENHFNHKKVEKIYFINTTFESIQEYVKIRNKLKEEGVDVIFTNCKEHDEYEQYISLTKRSVIYLTLISLAASAIAGITAGAVTAELDTALITAVFALATCAIASLVYYFKAGQEYPCSKASNLAKSGVQLNLNNNHNANRKPAVIKPSLTEPLLRRGPSSDTPQVQEPSGPNKKNTL